MNEIETTKAFQERVFEKIRADIGNLMTEAELKVLLDAAMKKAFFEPITKTEGYNTHEYPPLFVTMTQDLMKEEVKIAVQKWIEEHPKEMNDTISKVLAGGIAGAIALHLEMRFSHPLELLREELTQKGLVDRKY